MSQASEHETDMALRGHCNKAIDCFNKGDRQGAETELLGFLAFDTSALDVLDAMYQLAISLKHDDLAIQVCRKAIKNGYRFTSFSSHLMDLLQRTNKPALISDFISGVDYSKLAQFHMITGFRSSGVEQIEVILAKLFEIPRVSLRNQAYENQQYLFPPSLANYVAQNNVSGQNLTATEPDIQMMQAFAIRPVIVQRNIFDALYALKLRAVAANGKFKGAFFGSAIADFGDEEAMDAIIHRFGPDYIDFCVSWDRVRSANRLDTVAVDYATFVTDPVSALRPVIDFFGRDDIDEAIAAWANPVLEREDLTTGVLGIGHGVDNLTEAQKQKIMDMTRFYPDVDFRPYGLDVYPAA